jgi:2'-5' RNA ligase
MRVFLAFELEDGAKDRIWNEVIKTFHSKHLKLVERENYHITVIFFGEKGPDEVDDIVNLLREEEFSPIEYTAERVNFFVDSIGGIKVGFLELQNDGELRRIALKLREKLKGHFDDTKEFKTHITLFRAKRGYRIYRGKVMKKEWQERIQGKITKLTLFRSFLQKEGPLYKPIFTIYAKGDEAK